MVAPPVEAGAVQVTVLWVLAFDVADTLVGTPGTVDGVTAAEAAELVPAPETFIAATLKL